MRLYLNAESSKKIGYIPDWLKVSYKEDEKDLELTLDIQGDVDFDTDCLNCRCKGDLIPWVLYDRDSGDEEDLYSLLDEEISTRFPDEKVVEILRRGTDFRVGVYPADDSKSNMELAEDDTLTNCTGLCEIFESNIRFEFETEFNG